MHMKVMLSESLLFEHLLHVDIKIISMSEGNKDWQFLWLMTISRIASSVSSFHMKDIIMALRISGKYMGQETSVSFVRHCRTTGAAESEHVLYFMAVSPSAGSGHCVGVQISRRIRSPSCRQQLAVTAAQGPGN